MKRTLALCAGLRRFGYPHGKHTRKCSQANRKTPAEQEGDSQHRGIPDPGLGSSKQKNTLSDFSLLLAIRPSFIEGVARILDLAGSLSEYYESPDPEEADYLALRGDWYTTGQDIQSAMDHYAKETDKVLH